MDELKNLAAFIQVARSGSFTAAASELGVTTPTVSKAVSKLERRLDTRLFRRTTRQLSLTPEGRMFLESAAATLGRFDQAVDALREAKSEPAGQIRLWSSVAIGRDHVMPLLGEFLARYPKVDVEVRFDDHAPDLVATGYDLAVQHSSRREKSYVIRRLAELPLVLVASQAYLARHGTPRKPEDLTAHQCIATRAASGPPTVWVFSGNGKAKTRRVRVNPKGRIQVVEQFESVLDAALAGLGVTMVFAHSARRYLRSGELVVLLPDWRPTGASVDQSEVYLHLPQREYLPYKVRVLADFITEWFRDPGRLHFDAREWTGSRQ